METLEIERDGDVLRVWLNRPELDARFSAPDAQATPWSDVHAVLEGAEYDGDWDYEVRDGAFHHEGGRALVCRVPPTKVLAFARGDFAQTRYTFPDEA